MSSNIPPVQNIENTHPSDPPPTKGFALFEYGFRPFFFCAGLFAVISIVSWLGLYMGHFSLNLQSPATLWHAHEMLFGYTAAAIAGFFLTVLPNWTKAKAQKGGVLKILVLLWVLGRVVEWGQGVLPYGWVAVIDLSFLIALTVIIVRPLIKSQHRRQLMFVPILLSLIIANAMMHLSVMGFEGLGIDWGVQGTTLALDAVIVLITVMGGRVTPSFTSSFLGHANEHIKVVQNAKLDKSVIIATWGVLIVDQFWGASAISGGMYMIAAVLHFIRLAGWQGLRTLSQPIVWVLHLGYLWLVVGLVFKGLADFGLLDSASAVHALTIGAIGTMTIGIMSRASLGHTGRVIKPHVLVVAGYVALSLSAITRLSVAFWPEQLGPLVMVSGMLWALGFFLFFVVYAPILISPRIDGRPG